MGTSWVNVNSPDWTVYQYYAQVGQAQVHSKKGTKKGPDTIVQIDI